MRKKYNNSAERIALYVINSGKEITNLLLQKNAVALTVVVKPQLFIFLLFFYSL